MIYSICTMRIYDYRLCAILGAVGDQVFLPKLYSYRQVYFRSIYYSTRCIYIYMEIIVWS